jgi:hypothetical protein
MRWRSIRPVHGWPELVQQILIVVAGVLIALGAQQMVDDWQWRREVREFRAALDNELGYNLGAYRARLEQSGCIQRRLDQLSTWMGHVEDGEQLRLVSPIARPMMLAARTSVWESRTPEAASHLGLENRLIYAKLYDSVALYATQRGDERAVWNELMDFEGAEDLDRSDVMRLRGLIERGRFLERVTRLNWPTFQQRIAQMGIRAWSETDDPALVSALCQPLRWEAA